jgi:hypothetical protein
MINGVVLVESNEKNKPVGGCCGSSAGSQNAQAVDCCCSQEKNKGNCGCVSGEVVTPAGNVPLVSTRLNLADIFGAWKARWGIGRMNYQISPGLYGVGNPDWNLPVLVSANYKMSFDRLRRELTGLNLWIMVIDTKGINVWCAAGEGTFGTTEIVSRIGQVKLSEVVSHRTLIVPQLGAPGVAAHEVLKLSGFRVVYGPVRARDLPGFLAAGMKISGPAREVNFNLGDRLAVAPIEVVGTIKPALIVIAVIFIIKWIGLGAVAFPELLKGTLVDFVPFLGAILAGTVLVPALLPYIPGRSFAWKGWLLGLIWTILYIGLVIPPAGWKQDLFYILVLPPISSFLALNFTGASTYTSLSGVVKEMNVALPAIISSAGLGVLFLIFKFFVKF